MREDPPGIPEAMLLARIEQSEQMRTFFIQMWRENPQLVVGAGNRIIEIMSPLAIPPSPAVVEGK